MGIPTKQDYVEGQAVAFNYHDKLRTGNVDRVYDNRICVELTPGTDPDPAIKFKSFRFDKMEILNSVPQ